MGSFYEFKIKKNDVTDSVTRFCIGKEQEEVWF